MSEVAVLSPAAISEKPPLNNCERQVLILASLGSTVVEAAQRLEWSEDEVCITRDCLKEKWDVQNMAEAVDHGIRCGEIPIDADNPRQATPLEYVMLRTFASGRHLGDMAKALGRKNEAALAHTSKRLFKKIGANGRVHSVRRSYEVGIARLPATVDPA